MVTFCCNFLVAPNAISQNFARSNPDAYADATSSLTEPILTPILTCSLSVGIIKVIKSAILLRREDYIEGKERGSWPFWSV